MFLVLARTSEGSSTDTCGPPFLMKRRFCTCLADVFRAGESWPRVQAITWDRIIPLSEYSISAHMCVGGRLRSLVKRADISAKEARANLIACGTVLLTHQGGQEFVGHRNILHRKTVPNCAGEIQ